MRRLRFALVIAPVGVLALAGACTSFEAASDSVTDGGTSGSGEASVDGAFDAVPPDAPPGPDGGTCPSDRFCDDFERAQPANFGDWIYDPGDFGVRIETSTATHSQGLRSLHGIVPDGTEADAGNSYARARLHRTVAALGPAFEMTFDLEVGSLPTNGTAAVVSLTLGTKKEEEVPPPYLAIVNVTPSGLRLVYAERQSTGPPLDRPLAGTKGGWSSYRLSVGSGFVKLAREGDSPGEVTATTSPGLVVNDVAVGITVASLPTSAWEGYVDNVVMPK